MSEGRHRVAFGSTANLSNPCYKCPDRVLGCHSTCEKYQQFSKDSAEQREKIRQSKQASSVLNSYNPNKAKGGSPGLSRKTK